MPAAKKLFTVRNAPTNANGVSKLKTEPKYKTKPADPIDAPVKPKSLALL